MATVTMPCPTQMIETGIIDSGTINQSNGGNQNVTGLPVTFSKAFSAAPSVLAIAQSNDPEWGNETFFVASVSNLTKNGCTINVGNTGSGSITLSGERCVKWIAIGF